LFLREERPGAYLEALAGLIRSVAGSSVSVGTSYLFRIDRSVLWDVEVAEKETAVGS